MQAACRFAELPLKQVGPAKATESMGLDVMASESLYPGHHRAEAIYDGHVRASEVASARFPVP